MHRSAYRWALTFACSISLVLTPPLSAQAAGKTAAGPADAENLIRFTLENVKSTDQALILLSLTGATREQLTSIQKDLGGRYDGRDSRAEITLKDKQILVGGKPTRIRISSFSPLNVEYRGRVWAYEKSKSVEENYFSLAGHLSDRKAGSVFDLIVPEAKADSNETKGAAASKETADFSKFFGSITVALVAASGFVIGATVAEITAAVAVMAIVATIAGGLASSAIRKMMDGDEKGRELVWDILQSAEIKCDAERVVITPTRAANRGPDRALGRIQFEKRNLKDPIRLFDSKNQRISSDGISRPQRLALNLAHGCRNDGEAAQLQATLKKAVAMARDATGGRRPLPQPSSKPSVDG